MKSLVLITAMSTTGAVALIAGLLIVAGLIGYFTAWLYAKSVYLPVIKKLEAEKSNLENEITGLKNEISKHKTRIGELSSQIEELDKELSEKEREMSKMTDLTTGLEKELADLKNKVKV